MAKHDQKRLETTKKRLKTTHESFLVVSSRLGHKKTQKDIKIHKKRHKTTRNDQT